MVDWPRGEQLRDHPREMQTISRTGSPSGATDGEDAQDAALEVSLGSEGAEGGENVEDGESDGEDGQEEGAVTEGN